MSWQPIDIAPKTLGIQLLAYGYIPGSYGYSDDEWTRTIITRCVNGWAAQCGAGYVGGSFIPTHWQPLPEPPEG